MSKSRKRHRQPWWKSNATNRKSRKYWRRLWRLGAIKLTRFDDLMRDIYPKGIGL